MASDLAPKQRLSDEEVLAQITTFVSISPLLIDDQADLAAARRE